ncbi:MarR family winged helix-turn-helix transcriptional regulator [Natrinema thermotolerans]|uniref:MarR family winged helix-turn-helix transcriptional regulator n=1 Tax=Natrinema thermotolerans TaxID=121872 RepID=A0AAF0PBX2_9EURY|nr:MarR family winged helix-turn-helix transcriptional regulator [Natrinema thermotolerans]WPH65832.1 MarR family transcriptional regulator [Haloarchaeal virus HJTV-4]QCC60737.1 MarR family transcriptional regulator [Natrinema thermotolerans]QCC61615.1 MarR family transcriptional regulator [Natrinema thermotolerans]WMT07781.1 MarR family winged helix-turn-helix transcriptional regulator [Natrinema thermotolerans]WMT08413.1 MarR family winged helix-turn-helix transcriptional regulator [Natrinem
MPKQLPKEIADESAAVRLVYKTLEAEDAPLSQRDIVDATALTRRTIREAVPTLEDAGLVSSYNHPSDQRRRIYYLREEYDNVVGAHRAFTISER